MKGTGQLTFTTMGGDIVTVKARGKHYTQPKGYVRPPGTGPAGETCGSCLHLYRNRQSKVYLKCELARGIWTGGRGSDVLAGSPACEMWKAKPKDTP